MGLISGFMGGLTSRVLAVLFAVAAAQFPIYFTAYSNALAGAKFEAEARYNELVQEAAKLQLGVEDFIRRHETNSDEVFRASGRIHRNTLQRYRRYTAMQSALTNAPVWKRSVVLAQNFDPELHAVTQFQPGVPLNAEGAAYALAGLLLAWLLSASAGLVFGASPARPGARGVAR